MAKKHLLLLPIVIQKSNIQIIMKLVRLMINSYNYSEIQHIVI